MLATVIAVGAILSLFSSVQDDPALGVVREDPAAELTAEEGAYTRFVVPRLDRLIEEGAAVSSLVADRSRNLIALNAHANRIDSLTRDIRDWPADYPVPPRFQDAHDTLVRAGLTINGVIDDAEGMLTTLDFGGMSDLIPRFDSALAQLREVRASWPVAVQEPGSGTLRARGSDRVGASALHAFLGVADRRAPWHRRDDYE